MHWDRRNSQNLQLTAVAQVTQPTSGAHAAWVEILGADETAEAILKNPTMLTSPAETIKGTHEELVGILGADRAAATIFQCPVVLKSLAGIVMSASEALIAHPGKDGMLQLTMTRLGRLATTRFCWKRLATRSTRQQLWSKACWETPKEYTYCRKSLVCLGLLQHTLNETLRHCVQHLIVN